MTKNERSLLIVTCYGHFMSHFNMLVFPAVLLPLSARLGMGMADTLGLSFMMYLLFGLSALPWGFLADRFGPGILLAVFHLGAALSAFGAAISIDRPVLFSLALAGTGLFSGVYHPAGLGWIARETEKTSTAMAINGMFGNLGLAAAPFLAGIINYFYSIDALYAVVGGMNLLGLVFLVSGRVRGRGKKNKPVPVKVNSFSSWTPFYILLVAMMLGGIVYRGTSVTLPSYFELKNGGLFDALTRLTGGMGSANVTATLFTSIIYIGGMAGQFFGGMVGEKYDLRVSYFLFHAITIPAAIGMALTADIPLIVFALLHSFFLLGMQPIENTLVARLTPPKLISSAYGMKFILTFGVGALSVKVIKLIKLHWGIEYVFYALAAVSLLICLVTVFLWRNTAEKKL
ncbi:MFS transporter [Desulfomarina sp.]